MPLETPTSRDVATLVPERTQPRLGGGSDVGDFTAFTKPTLDQAEEILERSARAVYTVVGSYEAISDLDLRQSAMDVIALRAAAEIERVYPSTSDRTLFDALWAQYTADVKQLGSSIGESAAGGIEPGGSGVLPAASGLRPVEGSAGSAWPYWDAVEQW